ncbi:GNAT family N-acetyltransferase [Cytobacillus sp. Hz8]|uniref:GNAT family N-acetyltransferase n=1 Tax=Cytobacillus sp. Hz8 TaxID=3347168 RepID=UPI0035D7A648
MRIIKELQTEEEFMDGFSIMKELRTHLNLREYSTLLQEMKKEGYQMFALYDKGEIRAVTGICLRTNFYNGKHVFVYDLVTKAGMRSKGYGAELLHFIEEYGANHGASIIELTSGLQRMDAHRFYEKKMNFARTSFAFKKMIK